MKYTNIEMEAMKLSLEPLLERRDRIGYAAARNARILDGQLQEYSAFRDELVRKFGEDELDGDGNPTGRMTISQASPKFGDFLAEVEKIAKIEHEPDIFRLKYDEAIGELSGTELLAVDWMFED